MAGAGIRVFQPGEVLSAATVNTYLMDQAVNRFADVTARNAAFGAPGNLANLPVLSEGRICYLDSTNELQYYNGTSWVGISAEAISGQIQAKGDLIVGTAPTTAGRLPLGVNGQYLIANSATATGLAWADSVITDDSIVNADINAAAAISHSKLANITAGQVLLGNASNVPTATALSGDVTVTSGGVTAIGSGVIVNADISATAAIDLDKLADATIDEKSASYTLALTDKNKFIKMNVTTTANTVTVPTNASVAFPIGSQIHIIQYGTGKTQVIPVSGTVTIYATPGTYLRAQYSSATLLKCDTNIWMLMGDLSAS